MTLRCDSRVCCFLSLALYLVLGGAIGAQDKEATIMKLDLAWSLEGAFTGVVGDAKNGAIYAVEPNGNCAKASLEGKVQRTFQLPQPGARVVRLAQLSRDGGRALLAFTPWSGALVATDLEGNKLWEYPNGIDDVWPSDVNGDGADEVLVGFNGKVGLHVLDGRGELLWKTTDIGNVWHVCAGDVLGNGKNQIVTTSAIGKVHVFDHERKGNQRQDHAAGCYASMVRIGKVSEKDKHGLIFVAGSALNQGGNPAGLVLAALSGEGDPKWSLELPSGDPPHVISAFMAPGKPWLALGMMGGVVTVVDVERGEVVATVKDQGRAPEVGWGADGKAKSPLLLVATGTQLNAYRLTKPD
ncbi:MAG: FG-GAP repeat domain-containing protein [Planctomycetales bacterium]